MHVLDYIGLGRYGDKLDPMDDQKAMRELSCVLAPGAALLLAVSVGKARTVFNAHHIYAYKEIVAALPDLIVESFALITDSKHGSKLTFYADPALVAEQKYACGCRVLKRPV